MGSATHAFEEHRGAPILRNVEVGATTVDADQLPWQRVQEGQMPPMMFQVRLRDGVFESFPYGDIRRIRCRDAGKIQLETFSIPRTVISIEGRHLRELAVLLGNAMIRWIEETDDREVGPPEHSPAITRVRIELSSTN